MQNKIFINLYTLNFDFPLDWQCLFQDPATTLMENIIDLHHDIMFFLILITLLTSWMLARIIFFYNSNNIKTIRNPYATHNTLIEIIWTLIPTVILIIIALPSYALIYNIDELNDPRITLKIIGHQWYWSYEYADFIKTFDTTIGNASNFIFDSYMVKEEDLTEGHLRLLEVDNYVVLPVETTIRLLITASDVIHSWTVPSLGVKLDAVPGRLNQIGTYINRESVFFGQCSELCGINHSFMPIGVKVTTLNDFIDWINIKQHYLPFFLILGIKQTLRVYKYRIQEKVFGITLTKLSMQIDEVLDINLNISLKTYYPLEKYRINKNTKKFIILSIKWLFIYIFNNLGLIYKVPGYILHSIFLIIFIWLFFFKHIWYNFIIIYNFINLKIHELKIDTGGVDPNDIEPSIRTAFKHMKIAGTAAKLAVKTAPKWAICVGCFLGAAVGADFGAEIIGAKPPLRTMIRLPITRFAQKYMPEQMKDYNNPITQEINNSKEND